MAVTRQKKTTTATKATKAATAKTAAKPTTLKTAPAKTTAKATIAKAPAAKATIAKASTAKTTTGKATPARELPRTWRSPYSDFGHDLGDFQEETITANAVYTDEVLAGIAASGFNGIWVHGLLHHLVPSSVFPEFGEHSATHMKNMRELIERAARHNLRVFIYMQPPRGLDEDDPFWKKNKNVAGSPVENWQTLQGESRTYLSVCTSVPKVKKHLRESSARLAKELKGLGGVVLITASEYPSHCYRSSPTKCPRCAERTPMEVINEVIQLVRDGVRSVSKTMEIVAWNWSWAYVEKDPSPTILKNLPDDIILMADFERGDTKEILGKERPMDEYSLSFAGPSQRFMNCYRAARKRGIPIIPKLQLGTTHELATVPNLPLIGNIYEKAHQMQKLGITGFQGCWNFGNMISANSTAFNTFLNDENLPSRTVALENFASSYFPGCNATGVRHAWEAFAAAMDNYPFSIPFIYYGPMNYALGYQWKPAPLGNDPIGRSWVNDRPRGDRVESCLPPYTLEEVIRGMGKVARAWKRGAVLLEQALKGLDDRHTREELPNAWVCYHTWRSTWNLFRVYKLRLKWSDAKLDAYLDIAEDELENLRAVLPYVQADKRFGYHSEAHAYLYDAAEIRKKINALQRQLKAGGRG